MSTHGKNIIYTIGHSTHSMGDFLAMLQSFDIRALVDIRRFPGSRKFPQFDQDNLEASLRENNVRYIPMENLGGRRKVHQDSKNTRWRNASFRGYADYMETAEFVQGVEALAATALEWPTVYMCAEAVWWRCHRALISDYLKAKGWTVLHIMDVGKAEEHSYTSPATVIGDRVSYADEDLFNQ